MCHRQQNPMQCRSGMKAFPFVTKTRQRTVAKRSAQNGEKNKIKKHVWGSLSDSLLALLESLQRGSSATKGKACLCETGNANWSCTLAAASVLQARSSIKLGKGHVLRWKKTQMVPKNAQLGWKLWQIVAWQEVFQGFPFECRWVRAKGPAGEKEHFLERIEGCWRG